MNEEIPKTWVTSGRGAGKWGNKVVSVNKKFSLWNYFLKSYNRI
jgi:hypothetical protein